MKVTLEHPVYGFISYEESAWTGSKIITFNGMPLVKKNKTTYELPENPALGISALTVIVKGSYIGGVSLYVGNDIIPVTQKASVADWILGVLPAVMFFLFIMQGALGGLIAGFMVIGGVMLMKSRPNLAQKLLISLGASAVFVAIGVALIMMLLSQMQSMH